MSAPKQMLEKLVLIMQDAPRDSLKPDWVNIWDILGMKIQRNHQGYISGYLDTINMTFKVWVLKLLEARILSS